MNTLRAGDGQWLPGESGNPHGRPKTKLLTDALKAELVKRRRSGRIVETTAQRLMRRLIRIAEYGEDKDAIAAIKLALSYSEGAPVQAIEHEFTDVANFLANAIGVDPQRLIRRAKELRAAASPVYDAEPGTYRVMPVQRGTHHGSSDTGRSVDTDV